MTKSAWYIRRHGRDFAVAEQRERGGEAMSRRFDYDYMQSGELEDNVAQPVPYGIQPVPYAIQPEPYAAQLGQPDVESCSNGAIPDKAEPMEGKKKILVPVLTTMNKYLFDHYRLTMYNHVNRLLRNGMLSQIVGARVRNRIINREVLSFPRVSFWRINRNEFYADVSVKLKLDTSDGALEWYGYLVLWCSFGDEFSCSCEDLTNEIDRKDEGLDQLDSYLVPINDGKRVDEIAESIWKRYIPEALTNPKLRNAYKLAEVMGIEVKTCRIYEHRDVSTILFFEEDDLVVGEDFTEKDEYGNKERIKRKYPDPEHIMGNTIVVNQNLPSWKYSGYNVFHECYHYEEHYSFYRLQKMASNDPRKVEMKELVVDDGHEPNDPIYFMEKQANRGASALMMPASSTRRLIERYSHEVGSHRHSGELYEAIGKKMWYDLMVPYFRIRTRMIQLGYIQAKGALNYVDRELIQPFAFDLDAWREEQHTFVIDRGTVDLLYKKNDDFRAVMDSGNFIYADGHIVRNGERFVQQGDDKLLLTDWANAHVDECCLRFVRVYVQQNVGRYVFGRMYYDADYVKQTQFYLSDLINSEKLDELDAQEIYIRSFPKSFKSAIELLKKKNGVINTDAAMYMHMDDSTFARSLEDPRRYMNADFLTMLCLFFKLPDWISRLVFKRACVQLDEEIKRHQALLHILRVQSNDGLEAANAYLVRHNMAELKI